MNKQCLPDQEPVSANRLPTRTRSLWATAATLALAACASSPATNGDTSAHETAHPHSATAKPGGENKKSPETKLLTNQAQAAAEAMAIKVYNKYQNSPTKLTYIKKDSGKFYGTTVGIDEDTGIKVNGWPIERHMNVTLGKDVNTGDIDPKVVERIDVSFRKHTDGSMSDYSSYFEYQMSRTEDGLWEVGYIVSPKGTYNGFIPQPNYISSDAPMDTSKKLTTPQPDQLEYFAQVTNDVIDGNVSFEQLDRLVLPG